VDPPGIYQKPGRSFSSTTAAGQKGVTDAENHLVLPELRYGITAVEDELPQLS